MSSRYGVIALALVAATGLGVAARGQQAAAKPSVVVYKSPT